MTPLLRLGGRAYRVRPVPAGERERLDRALAEAGDDLAELLEWTWEALDVLLAAEDVIALQRGVTSAERLPRYGELVTRTLGMWRALGRLDAAGDQGGYQGVIRGGRPPRRTGRAGDAIG